MSRIKEAFKDGKALIGFLTAGVPSAEDTLRYMEDLETAGADLIEIGVPFSDPVADGAVIMEADVQALKNKVHLPQVMEIVKAFRKQSETPLVFLTYYNPIFNYGVKKFFEEAKDIGLDGVAIPDLPYEEQSGNTSFCRYIWNRYHTDYRTGIGKTYLPKCGKCDRICVHRIFC